MTGRRKKWLTGGRIASLAAILIGISAFLAYRYQSPTNSDLVILSLRAIDDTRVVHDSGDGELHLDQASLDRLPVPVRDAVLDRIKQRWPGALLSPAATVTDANLDVWFRPTTDFSPWVKPGRTLLLFELSETGSDYRFLCYSVASDGYRTADGVAGIYLYGRWQRFLEIRRVITHTRSHSGADERVK